MKKLFFTTVLSLFVMGSYAQKKVLKSAEKAFKKGEYETATQLAQAASENAETADNPQVYILLGKISLAQFEASENSDPALALAAYEQFKIAMEKGDEKLIAKMMEPPVMAQVPGQDSQMQTGGSETMALLERYMLMGGNDALNMDEYEKAFRFFAIASNINPSDELNFFAGYSAESADMAEEMVEYYNKVVESKSDSLYENANFAYNGIIQHYLSNDMPDEAMVYIKKAQQVYPEDDLYPKWEVDVLISTDKLDEAITGLEAVIGNGDADAQTYTQLAFLHWKSEDLAKAQEIGLLAVAKDSESYDGNYVLGGAIYDEAANILREANNEMDNTKYEALKEKAVAKFSEAKPYFEKCIELRPEDSALFAPLSTIYEQLKMMDKRDEMLKKMEASDSGN
jgi:tetratricopeptide (TPR) repeat protein